MGNYWSWRRNKNQKLLSVMFRIVNMQELLQHADLLNQIIAGEKHATVRKGRRDITPGPLKLKGTDSGREHEVDVTVVEFIKYNELNSYHAKIDGYSNLEDLNQRLTAIYGELPEDQEMTVVYWS